MLNAPNRFRWKMGSPTDENEQKKQPYSTELLVYISLGALIVLWFVLSKTPIG
jgi:ABC-type uncharacterized transport system permease subunit